MPTWSDTPREETRSSRLEALDSRTGRIVAVAKEHEMALMPTLKQASSSGTDLAYSASINPGKTVITIDPTSDLPAGRVYVAVSNGYYDAAGNAGTSPSRSTHRPATRTCPA
ncbi:MAG: Ig-like domain-containing protein [Gammaproteobacteria bacterium]|nr:Ig-like domain-containing protein [Gammaproteobacteria bacterium]